MSLWKSPAVKEWVAAQEPELYQRRTTRVDKKSGEQIPIRGRKTKPKLSKRQQATHLKAAIFGGEVQLEPTVMPFEPRFKGNKRRRNAPQRQAEIELKMADMPRLIAEYRQERREFKDKMRKEKRFK